MLRRYLEWRTAAARFGQRPWQLEKQERAGMTSQVEREYRVITAALAVEEAREVRADLEVVEAAALALGEGFADHSTFIAELTRAGLDWPGLLEAIGAELRAGLVLEGIGASAVVEEARVRAYYDAQRAGMVLPERRAARHILITINDDYAENTRANAQRRLDAVADAVRHGDDFAALAAQHSECPSGLDGGNLGQVRRGQLYPELEQTLFQLQPGEVGAVESALGLHLLRCDAVYPAEPIPYERAAPSIRRKLEAAEKDRVLRAWLKSVEGNGA